MKPSVSACAAVMVVALAACSADEAAPPPCVLSPVDMPASWRPADAARHVLHTSSWTEGEEDEAEFAIRTGVAEMVDLYDRRPEAVPDLWEDSVASLIEVSYSGANAPDLDRDVRDAARRNLSMLIQPYLGGEEEPPICEDYSSLVPLAVYAHNQYEANDARTDVIAELTNAAYRSCTSLGEAMGIDYEPVIAGEEETTDEEVFDLVIWSLLMIEVQVVPGLEVTEEMRAFPAALWRFLETYPLDGAGSYPDGAFDEDFIEEAYLATHIAYIPTGNHRFPLYVEDSPPLYDFHRENFYPVLEMGELDLVAEFVDSLRQYGCTPENDLQVRDGTRYLLHVFQSGQDQWMTYREPGETDDDVDDYDLIHKAWTGVLGIRDRSIEPAEPGTYGGVVRGWLPAPDGQTPD